MTKDDDRSNKLLSKEVLPKVKVPEFAAHKKREFRLPSVLSKPIRAVKDPDAAARAADSRTRKTRKNKVAKAKKRTAKAKAKAKPAKSGKDDPRQPGPKAQAPATPLKKRPKRSPTATGRFRDRTLNWFRIGDDIAETDETNELEPEFHRARWLPLAILAVGGVVVVVALVMWATS